MNISDIAKLAGVAPSTVSRYLNNGYVSKEKKKIISKVIKETKYTPLAAARNLRSPKIRTIGIIVPRINSESVSHMVDGITKRFKETNYEILLGNTYNNSQKEIYYLDYFDKNQVDGVIFIATKFNQEHIDIIENYRKPIVISGQNINGFPSVYNDDEGAAYEATTHLIDQGCHKIVYLGVIEDDLAAGLNRHKGFNKALEDYDLEPVIEKIVDFSAFEGYSGISEILNSEIEFDGVFCATDNIAAGVINSLYYSDIRVPDDVKVIGIGDSIISKTLIPPITSIHLYYDEIGYEAADMIITYIDNHAKSARKIQLGYELCQRESTENKESS